MPKRICPYCNKPIADNEVGRDHILPRVRGGTNIDGNNIRIVHKVCNNLKEHAGDCIGVLACARAVAEDSPFHTRLNRRTRTILIKWHLMYQN